MMSSGGRLCKEGVGVPSWIVMVAWILLSWIRRDLSFVDRLRAR